MNFLSNLRKELKTIVSDVEQKIDPVESLIKLGLIVKNKRKELGFSRSDLAKKTRITPAVIEAIENAWENKLPEKTYLISMLSILELELGLASRSLSELIPQRSTKKRAVQKEFIPDLDIFYTWKGSLFYIAILSLSLYILNYSHRRSILIEGKTITESINRTNITPLKKLDKDAILTKKRKRSMMEIISLNGFIAKKSPKWIIINIKTLVDISIKSMPNQIIKLNKYQGKLELKLRSPIKIETNPPLSKKDLIIWDGKEFTPKENNIGTYKFD